MPKKPTKKKAAPKKAATPTPTPTAEEYKEAIASAFPASNPKEVKLVNDTVAVLEKQYGTGVVQRMGDQANLNVNGYEVISSGSFSLDRIIGIGGLPTGRVVEIYGKESCIAGESFLAYEVWKDGKSVNVKGGSIRRLYERFHQYQTDEEPKQGRHLQINEGVEFYVKSVNHENAVICNKVLDVVCTGRKVCFRIDTENGKTLFATEEHKFMTPNGFVPLSDLNRGDEVYTHDNVRIKGRKKYTTRPAICVKNHPNLPVKIVHCNKVNKDYVYKRGQTSRLAYEAFLNKMEFSDYINFLNTKPLTEINELEFLPDNVHVHHLDEDFTNNNIDNLCLIDPSEHGKLHAADRKLNLSFVAVPSKIVSIERMHTMDTYDLRCEFPYNNYIAEGIVVHNSGKTTLALHIIANAQRQGGICSFIDAEHALDTAYAANLGVDVDNLLLTQPDYGEQALDIASTLVKGGGVKVIVIDSVAALVPKAEIEGDIDSTSQPGIHARLMSKSLRKITSEIGKSKTLVVFINQTRSKIGVMFGNPETTTGGNALKFYTSLRLEIARIGAVKKGDSAIGNRTRIKVVKNKLAPPFKSTEIDIIYGKGISYSMDVLDAALAKGLVEKKGASYSYKNEFIGQGRLNAGTFLDQNPAIINQMKEELL